MQRSQPNGNRALVRPINRCAPNARETSSAPLRVFTCLMAVLVVGWLATFPALGFKTGTVIAGKKIYRNVHLQIFNEALKPIGFQDDAIAKINEGHMSNDELLSEKFYIDSHHCDSNNIQHGFDYFREQMENALVIAEDAYKDTYHRDRARYMIGEGYHALQDFYSHSNWVEIQFFNGAAANDITPFRWDDHTKWEWNKERFLFTRPWNLGKWPAQLKTGYFSDSEVTGNRSRMLEEVRNRNKLLKPNLRFPSDEDLRKRKANSNYFLTAIEYVVKDPGMSMLHYELNKDDENELEGSLVSPGGEKLFDVARRMATIDTQRQWKNVEELAWDKYGGCTALIIPAIKGNPIPEIRMKLKVDRGQQARNRPVKGSVALTVANLPKPMRQPIKVEVKIYLEPTADPGTREQNAIKKVLEFRDSSEQIIPLEPLNLVIGNRTGSYDLVAKASFECDPQFKPNKQQVTLGTHGLELRSATYSPNPWFAGELGKLSVLYEYDETSGSVYGQGTIRSEDGTTYALVLDKKKLNATRAGPNMELPPYEESWTPPKPGKYIWSPRLSTDLNEQVRDAVEIVVKQRADKLVNGNGVLNKTTGDVGDQFVLTIPYTVSGVPRNGTVTVEEKSIIDQVDGATVFSSIQDPPVSLATSTGDPINRTVKLTYTATKGGVFDWWYRINVPGYGTISDTLRFTVNTAKNLVIDEESVSPELGPAGTQFVLTVRYHLRGMKPNDRQEITEKSEITRTENIALPPRPRFQIHESDPKGTMIERCDRATKPGVYVWTYDIDAGPYGRDRRSVTFRVTEPKVNRDIQLVSASVSPVKGAVGTTHTLTVRYKLIGLKPKETVEVHENDYVEYSKQESHATVTKQVTEPRVIVTKVAGFVSKYAGKHAWNFIIDCDGFKTLYGSVPFEAYEEDVRTVLNARLDYSMITLAPGETKNCSIHISGYKGNTSDRVEVVFPQVTDNWGSMPGQIQVFPGSTSMEPWSMRGAGDYTKEYSLGQGYRARETALPGITPVRIIVRQKGAGQVTLTLFVKVVRKGESTFGTEQDTPLLPGTYSPRTRPPGEPQIPNVGEPDVPTTVRTDANGNPVDAQGNPVDAQGNPVDAQGNPIGGPGASTTSPGSTLSPGSNRVPGSSTTSPGSQPGITSTDPNGPPSLSEDEDAVVYELSHVLISRPHIANDKKSTEAKGEDSISWEDDQGSIGTVKATGTITWDFPKQITLRSDGAGKYTTTFNTTQEARFHVEVSKAGTHKDPRKFGIYTATKTLDEKTLLGDDVYSPTGSASYTVTVFEVPSFDRTTSSTSSKPTKHNEPLVEFSPDYFGFHFDKPSVLPHGIAATPFYVHKPGAKPDSPSNTDPNSQTNDQNQEGKDKPQLKARLEKDEIVVEAGSLPSTRSAIIISGWDRTTSKPIEVIYPGLGFMGSLPNDLHVFSGAGRQEPDVMNRGAADNGEYTWIESYDAKMQAKPGIYQIPIVIRQEGAGSVQLVQTIKIVPSSSPFGNLTMLQNRTQPPAVPPSPTSIPPMTHTPTFSPPAPTAVPPMTHVPTFTPPTSVPPMTHTPTYTPPAPTHTPSYMPPAPTTVPPMTHTPTPAAEEVDWRCMAGKWQTDGGMIINVTVSGDSLSATCLYAGDAPRIQLYPGDPTFLDARPTGKMTFSTQKGYCYAVKGDNVKPRGVAIRMNGKINATCDRLTLQFWTLKHNSTNWVAGTETFGSVDFVRFRGTVPSSPSTPQQPARTPTFTVPIPTFTPPTYTPPVQTPSHTPTYTPPTYIPPVQTPAHTPPKTQTQTQTCPPGTAPGAPTPPQPAHENKPSGFAGTWLCETFGAIKFTDYVGGRCRGDFQPGANAKGYFDGYAANGVFNGIYNMEYFGEKMTGRLVIRYRDEKNYLFRADYTSSSGRTGYWTGAKSD